MTRKAPETSIEEASLRLLKMSGKLEKMIQETRAMLKKM
jgi:hypothetical protein